jgi:hypothetical protein
MTLKNAGVGINDLNIGGIQTISALSKAHSIDDLDRLYNNDISKRGDVTDSDKDELAKARNSGDFQTYLNELVRVLSGKGQSDDAATIQRSIDANIADMKTDIGQKLIPLTQEIMQDMLKVAQFFGAVPKDVDQHANGQLGPNGFSGGSDAPGAVAAGATRAPGGSTVGGRGFVRPKAAPGSGGSWIDTGKGYLASLTASSDGGVASAVAYFQGQGYSKAQAEGLAANFYTESGMNPAASGDNGNAYGIGQWHKDRQDQFAKLYGHGIKGSSLQEQLRFAQWELTHSEKAAGDKLRGATSAGQAGDFASRYYERPSDVEGQARQRGELATQLDKIPAKYRGDGISTASRVEHQTGVSDIHIHLDQTIKSAGTNGQTKTTKMNTTISAPTSSGTAKATLVGN